VRTAVLVLALAACGGRGIGAAIDNAPTAETVPLQAGAIGVHPGESMTYAVTIANLDAGEVAIATGEPGQIGGRRAVIVATRGSVTGVFGLVKYMRADGESALDLDTGEPISLVGSVDWGGKHLTTHAEFDVGRVTMEWLHGGRVIEHISHDLGTIPIHGAVSATAAVRASTAEPGMRGTLRMMGALRLWTIDVVWVGSELLDTALGRLPAIRVDGVARTDTGVRVKFSAWMSDDTDRVPLRLDADAKLGTARFEISSYTPP
jgi:hypothetical protein